MKPIAWRIQLEVIASAYAGILLMGTFWFYQRHLQEFERSAGSDGVERHVGVW